VSDDATAARTDLRERLHDLGPERFAAFVADVWREVLGWETRVVGAPGDRGIDVVAATGAGDERVVQAKRYGPDTAIDDGEIRQYASLRLERDAEGVTVVTTGEFTGRARAVAAEEPVVLVDGDALVDLLAAYDAEPLVAAYFGDVDGAGSYDDDAPPAERRKRLEDLLDDGGGPLARLRSALGLD
jgi:restriction system protein